MNDERPPYFHAGPDERPLVDACWCCGRGVEAHDSHYLCPRCEAHSASRGPAPAGFRMRQGS